MNKGYIQLINHRRRSGIELFKNGMVLSPNQVRSESDLATVYETTLDSCSCPDYQRRLTKSKDGNIFVCKHINAQLLNQGIENEDSFIITEVDI